MTNSEIATARWAVALEGDPFDIEDARDLFAKHDEVQVCIIEVAPDRNPTVLLAKEFENLSSNSEVSEASRRIFDLLNGIMFVRDRVRKPVQPGAVYERREDGRWSAGTIFAKLAAFEDRDRFLRCGSDLASTRVTSTVSSPSTASHGLADRSNTRRHACRRVDISARRA
jgi:hypothetical protein